MVKEEPLLQLPDSSQRGLLLQDPHATIEIADLRTVNHVRSSSEGGITTDEARRRSVTTGWQLLLSPERMASISGFPKTAHVNL